MSDNYDFVIAKLAGLHSPEERASIKVLDFGCGCGQIVEKGLDAGFDFHGADPYVSSPHRYDEVHEKDSRLGSRIHRIENDQLPFEDGSFDVVVSNQVFEHVADLDSALREVRRVLKPGGLFLALFPTRNTWWEGHCHLFFAHWITPRSKLAYYYYKTLRALGFGTKLEMSPHEWAVCYQEYLGTKCFYRTNKVIAASWRKFFGRSPEGWESDYMLFRLEKSRLKSLLSLFKNKLGLGLLSLLCRIRAGRVFVTYNCK